MMSAKFAIGADIAFTTLLRRQARETLPSLA